MKWELENVVEEYRDYCIGFEGVNEHGGSIRLSIDTNKRTAWLSIVLDNESGNRFLEHEIPVKLPWALAVAHGVDGFTLSPEEATA